MRADRAIEIVGVVRPVRHYGLVAVPRETVYRPFAQFTPLEMFIVLRTRQDPDTLAPSVTSAVQDVDAGLAVSELAPFEALVARSAAQPALQAQLVGLFGVTAITLAALGIYALLAFIVSERTREIGVRVALGATRIAIVRSVLAETARLAAFGVAAGSLVLIAAAPALRQLLQLSLTYDPRIAIGPLLVLSCAGTIASVAPALRASRIDPAIALRKES